MFPEALAERPFTTATARAHGLDAHELRRLVRDGIIRRQVRGTYIAVTVPDTTENRCAAAALVIHSSAVICDRTAAWIWGVGDPDPTAPSPPLDVILLRGKGRARRDGCVSGERDLTDRDVVFLHGLRITSPLRTALDLACRSRRRDALAVIEGFMREHGLTRQELQRELVRFFRRRGVVQARELVGIADPRSESPGESWVRLELHDRGFELPVPNQWVYDDAVAVYRLDLPWIREKVAVEYDGRRFHGEDATAHDEQRRAWLARRGWTIHVVHAEDFSSEERIDGWVHEVRADLDEARARRRTAG